MKKGVQLFSQAPVGNSSFLRQDTKNTARSLVWAVLCLRLAVHYYVPFVHRCNSYIIQISLEELHIYIEM